MDNFSEEMNFLNAPNFPGQQLGKVSIDQVRSVIKRQKRIKGYEFTAQTGTSSFNLDLSGTARILLGIAMYGQYVDPETPFKGGSCCTPFTQISTVQFKVNNEIVIDTLNPNFLSFGFNTNEYYYLPRPLSGTDELTLVFTNNLLPENVYVVLYYI
jgi:hypothetical protein